MSVWIRNLETSLADRPVVILYGNVRDKYIDEHGRVYENLTALLTELSRRLPIPFAELVFYDPVGHERRVTANGKPVAEPADDGKAEGEGAAPKSDLAASEPKARSGQKAPPTRVLANWTKQLSAGEQSRFVALYYLDKLIPYKTSYSDEEKETLLWLEKLIENITPNHRLVMVALQDTLVPTELYTSAPKTRVLPIPPPDKEDRRHYLCHRLGEGHSHIELISDLTDGLFLRDLDNIVNALAGKPDPGAREVRRLVNKYRLGEQEDYWGTLSVEKLNGAIRRFVEEEGVRGQDEAIRKVVDTLCLARAGLSGLASGTAAKPKGVLFFAGPTGVGKTLVAKKLAKFLFSTEEAFVRFDMSEFKEEHTVSKLIGSPPGYVGFERGGMLTNAVREKPFAVILFDEIEKAHPKVMDIFLQLLDDGRLTDNRGQTVFFTEAVIIFTSNLGTRTNDSRGTPTMERAGLEEILIDEELSDDERKTRIRAHFSNSVEEFFNYEISRPELLNRIGNNIVPFNYIHTRDAQQEIVTAHLKRIKAEFADRYRQMGYQLHFDEAIPTWVVTKHGEKMGQFGGRGITTALQEEIMLPLSRAVLRAEYRNTGAVTFGFTISPDGGDLVVGEE